MAQWLGEKKQKKTQKTLKPEQHTQLSIHNESVIDLHTVPINC